MDGPEAWTVTFVDAGGPGATPFRERVQAALKCLGRYWKLKLVADWPLRQQVIEECCAKLCPDCAAGLCVGRDSLGVWWHRKVKSICGAHQLREGLFQEERRAKDASHMEDPAPLSPLPGAPEQRRRGGV